MIEGENYELICRNESGHRRGDKLRLVDRGRHGPGVTNAAAVQNRAPCRSNNSSQFILLNSSCPSANRESLITDFDCLGQGTLQ